jgi:hypothetical protein
VLYLFECVVKLPMGSLVLASGVRPDRYRVKAPVQLSSGSSSGWMFLNPAGIGTPVFCSCADYPHLVPDGLLLRGAVRADWRLLEFDSIRTVSTSDEQVLIDAPAATVECLSATHADEFAKLLDQLRKLPVELRLKEIRARELRAMNQEQIRKEARKLRMETRWLRRLGILMMALVLLFLPLAIRIFGFEPGLLSFLIAAFAISIAAGYLYHPLAQSMNPSASRPQKWMSTLHVALYPLSVPRCVDAFSLQALRKYNVAAMAFVLGGGRSLAEEAVKLELGQLPSADPATADANVIAAIDEYAARRTAILREFLKSIGSSMEDIAGACAPRSPDCKTYCPRCFAQYRIEDGTCSDCAGVRLRSFRSQPENR